MADTTDDLGAPITELLELDEIAPEGFLGRVVSSIRRRRLASQVATFSWTGFGVVFAELLQILHGFLGAATDEGGRS